MEEPVINSDAGSRSFYAVSALSLLVSADTSWRAFGLLGVTQV